MRADQGIPWRGCQIERSLPVTLHMVPESLCDVEKSSPAYVEEVKGREFATSTCDLVNTSEPTGTESKAAATAFHLGIPNFKLFLSLRFLLSVWSVFLGLFYDEIVGWAMGLLMLAVALVQTAARIRPSLWIRYRKSLLVVDALSAFLALFGCARYTLVRGLYVFSLPYLLSQLVLQLLVWPNRKAHPFCYPTYRKRVCGSMSTDIDALTKETMKPSSWRLKKLPFFLLWTTVFSAFLMVVATTGQRLMIYPGTLFKVRIPNDFPGHLGLDVELVSFFTADSKRLSALFMKPSAEAEKLIDASKPRLTMWIFYGNTGNMIHQMDCVVPLMQKAYPNLQFFIFSYRGYANSDGRPHIAGLRQDIDAAVRYLSRRADVDRNKIVAYGHSIGGALVSDVLGRHPGVLQAVILSNTFLSMSRMADTWHMQILKPFISEPWDSESSLRKAVANNSLPPILFMTSRKDELIPAYHMDGLYEIAMKAKGVAQKHTKLVLPEGLHNYWNDPEMVHKHWTKFFLDASVNKP